MKGSVIPVIGAKPNVIPIFTAIWKNKNTAKQKQIKVNKRAIKREYKDNKIRVRPAILKNIPLQ